MSGAIHEAQRWPSKRPQPATNAHAHRAVTDKAPGYDILCFDPHGRGSCIEVKTTERLELECRELYVGMTRASDGR